MDNPVIAADDFSPGAIRILEANAANYADRRRLHIHLPDAGLSVHVEEVGLGPIDPAPRALSRLSGATGAVVLALLEASEAEHKVTVLADQAGVSPATAQKVLFGLETDGLLAVAGRGPNKVRTLTDPSALLDRYAADAAADRRLTLRCRIIGDEPIEIVERAAEALGRASVPYCVTGVAAALLEAPALTVVSRPELWVQGPRTPEYLLRVVDGLASDDGGNLILWRATTRGPMALSRYGENPHLRLASRFRVYADLLASPQRGREQAEVYRERVIGF
jgi:predicted transcriptional regulator